MADLLLSQVSKTFGATPAVRALDLSIADGEFLVIVGPSGCGKSTLLRLIAGLEELSGGEIYIGGRPVAKVEPKDRDIAMVFQNYALYPHMSVFENMAYSLKIRGRPKAEIRRRVEEAADILQIRALLGRKPGQLSGGQRQRVAMGRALVRNPAVFLFDEPLSNLDAKLRVQMRVEIKRLHARLKTTSIYVTHDQVEAMTLADRIVILRDGRAEQVGTPIELYERPASSFVAGFIGNPAMNLLPAQIDEAPEGCGGPRIALAPGIALPLAVLGLPPSGALSPGKLLRLGVRPEHLRPVEANGTALPPFGDLRVELVERHGADSVLHGRLLPSEGSGAPGQAETGAAASSSTSEAASAPEIVLRLPGAQTVEEGERIPLTVDPADLHLFDAETGQRLDLEKDA